MSNRSPHYLQLLPRIDRARKQGDDRLGERLLLQAIQSTEAESLRDGLGVAPYYYERLAIIYRRQKRYGDEVAVLERFAQQKHAPGVKPPILLARLEKARELALRVRADSKGAAV